MTSVPGSVECPDCGESFDPKTQGGWCTNRDCGNYKWEPDETESEPVEPANEPPSGPETGGSAGGGGGEDGGQTDPTEVVCPSCNESVPNKEFCLNCGDELDVDDTGETADDPTCPQCGEEVEESWAACVSCGTQLDNDSDDHGPAETTPTCPQCGEEVEEEWAACINCGENLSDSEVGGGGPDTTDPADAGPAATDPSGSGPTADADVSEAPEKVIFEVGGSEVRLENGDSVGRKIRTAHVQAGGDEEEARYISRDHALIEQKDGDFYIVNKHRNGLEVNSEEVPVDERKPLTEGGQVTLAGVASATVRLE